MIYWNSVQLFKNCFVGLIDDTENNHTKYMAPYFPIIQSSGSGKTRLFRALVEVSNDDRNIDYQCVMILLQNSRNDKIDDGDLSKYFDEKFTLMT